MKKLFAVCLCAGALMLSGCGAVALGVAGAVSSNLDEMLKADYARYVIEKQNNGMNDISSYDAWFDGKYKNLAEYGQYYDKCKKYPGQNEGGPLAYHDWVTFKPEAKVLTANH